MPDRIRVTWQKTLVGRSQTTTEIAATKRAATRTRPRRVMTQGRATIAVHAMIAARPMIVVRPMSAVHAMTGRTADAYRVPARGRLVVGAVADVVVLDPTTVRDGATWDDPLGRPVGIEHVLLGGAFALRDGDLADVRLGSVLSAGSPAT